MRWVADLDVCDQQGIEIVSHLPGAVRAPLPSFVAGWDEACTHADLGHKVKTKATLLKPAADAVSLPKLGPGRQLGGGAWEFQLEPAAGATLYDVELASEQLCAELKLHRLSVVRENAHTGKLIVNTVDPFPPVVPWSPPRPGHGYWAKYGVTAAGTTFGFRVGRAPHMLAAGSTNSGKSRLLLGGVASAACMEGVEFWGVDPKELDLPLFENRFSDLVIGDDPDEIREFLHRVLAAMKARQAFLAQAGVSNLQEWCDENAVAWCEEYPWVELVLDEIQDVLSIPKLEPKDRDEKTCIAMVWEIARKARAVGIRVTGATQNPLAKVFPTEIRGQFGSRWVGKTQGPEETKVGIGNADAAKRCPAHTIRELSGEAYYIGPSTSLDTREWWFSAQPQNVKGAYFSNDEARRVCEVSMRLKPAPSLPGCGVVASRVPPATVEPVADVPPCDPDELLPKKPNWAYVKADGFPWPTPEGKAAEHRRAAWEYYGNSFACMTCGVVGDFSKDSLRVASIDGTRDTSRGNLRVLCAECMGRAKGSKRKRPTTDRPPTEGPT